MKFVSLVFLIFLFQDVPYKSKDEFEIKLNFEFKQRPSTDIYTVKFDETQKEHERRTQTGPLPYISLNLKVLKTSPQEVKLRIVDSAKENVMTKKVDLSKTVKIDLGFTDDIKDRVSPHEYTIYFLSPEKQPVSRILVSFEEDGTYSINGEKRGKI